MRILGVELGSWSLKAVEMESRFRRLDVLDFHEIRLPLQLVDPTEIYSAAVAQLMARLPSHPEKIVTSIPAAQTALRFLPIPVKQRKKVEQMFRFELEDNVPFKLEDAIIEHFVSRTKEGSLVFAAIAPKKHIHTYLDWLRSIGLDPDWLTFEGMGLINLYLSSLEGNKKMEPEPSIGPTLLLDLGHYKTNLSIYNDQRLQLFRSMAWGGYVITQQLAITMGAALEEAERYKMNDLRLDQDLSGASEETRELTRSAHQSLSPLISDITHSLVAFRNLYRTEVTRILISGGTARTWGIESYLQNHLRLPVSQFRPLENLPLKEELRSAVDESRFGEPVGRAMVFARKVSLLFNFRQQDMGKGTSLVEVTTFLKNPNVIKLMKYAAVLAGILLGYVLIAQQLADSEAHTASEELRKAFSKTFPNVPSKQKLTMTKSPELLKKFIDQKNQELDQKLKMISKSRVPMLGLINSISSAFPSEVRVDVNVLQIDDHSFSLEGVLYSGDINRVTENLKKITSFNRVALQRDGQRFFYRGEVLGR